MELNIKKYDRQGMLDLTKELSRTDPRMQKYIGLAGIDCSDGETSMDWEERCYAYEGYVQYLEETIANLTKEKSICVEVPKDSFKELPLNESPKD